MKSNAELKELAWRRLWTDHWFGRLFGGSVLLAICGSAIQIVLGGVLGRLHVQTWTDYAQAVFQNRQDLTTPVPNLTGQFVSQATSSTVLTQFFSLLMGGIAAYGCAVILLRCIRNREEGWLGAAFGGFKCPFGVLWLSVRLVLVYLGWTIVAVGVPGFIAGVATPFGKFLETESLLVLLVVGITLGLCWATWIYCIPFYRYRFLWLVKAEHPDWGAGQCMGECRELMRGNMMKSFRLDCAYWKPLLLVLLPFAGICIFCGLGFAFDAKALMVSGIALCAVSALPIGWVVGMYIHVGQGLFYRELVENKTERN